MRDVSRKVIRLTLFLLLGFMLGGCINKDVKVPEQEVKQILTPQEIRKSKVSKMGEADREKAFAVAMNEIKNDVKNNPKYTKITLDKPVDNRKWFKDSIYKLWSGEITKDAFIQDGLSKYPTKDYEFYFIASSVLSH